VTIELCATHDGGDAEPAGSDVMTVGVDPLIVAPLAGTRVTDHVRPGPPLIPKSTLRFVVATPVAPVGGYAK
jgi:hypothetical protein